MWFWLKLTSALMCCAWLRLTILHAFRPVFPTLDVADEADSGASGLLDVAEDALEVRLTPKALIQGLDGLLRLRTQG